MKTPKPRLNLGSATLIALAAIAVIMPDADWISIMRGEVRFRAELAQAQTAGYYEALLGGSKPGAVADNAPASEADGQKVVIPPGWRPFAESGIVDPVDTFLRWRMKPNIRMTWNGTRFTTNRLGYRTPEVAVPKPPDTYRIVVLGSSNTMGHGVNDDQLFARLLEGWMNRPEVNQGRRVEVVNLAVSSDSPSQNLVRLLEDVPKLQADWILNDVTVLDYSLEELHLHSIVQRNVPIPFPYIRDILREAGISPSDPLPVFSAKLQASTEALLDGAYRGWSEGAAKIGVPMTLFALPRTDAKIANPNLRKMSVRLAHRYSLPMIDLTGAYKERDISEYRLSAWDKHPSVLGHRLIFEGLREEILRQGGGPGLTLKAEEIQTIGESAARVPSVNPT